MLWDKMIKDMQQKMNPQEKAQFRKALDQLPPKK